MKDAFEIIESYQKSAPVQTVPIANSLGIEVYKDKSLSSEISGVIVKDSEIGGKSGYAIIVNAAHSENRRRFTIAHEIAHYVLHKNKIGDGIVDSVLYRSGDISDNLEIEANKFAAEILMPWELINKSQDSGAKTVEDISKYLKVSPSALSIRLGAPID